MLLNLVPFRHFGDFVMLQKFFEIIKFGNTISSEKIRTDVKSRTFEPMPIG